MKLFIVSNTSKRSERDAYFLPTHTLKVNATHLFIASYVWESIYIELDDNIPEGSLRKLNTVCNFIKVKIPSEFDSTVMGLLVELYPKKAGAIRRAFMQQRSIKEVLSNEIWSDLPEV